MCLNKFFFTGVLFFAHSRQVKYNTGVAGKGLMAFDNGLEELENSQQQKISGLNAAGSGPQVGKEVMPLERELEH